MFLDEPTDWGFAELPGRSETKTEGSEPEGARDANLGRRIGPYRIERLVARGGMGVVYLAVREDEYEQQVALKLIDSDRLSSESLVRFYRERQILAQLQHPNIARILDGGTTDEVLPYFVMEYVEGEPIDRYCEARRLPLRQRLELFRTVCSAVHFAHQNLVVHRDLKPGNILVTAEGTVKLLDFGIAKILSDKTFYPDASTGASRAPMTPSFASPEQVLGQEISTASDVYCLGVLLCWLVSGRLPYRMPRLTPSIPPEGDGHGPAKLVEAISEARLIAPSDALRQAGAGHHRLARQMDGDIDAIVMKALCKEPQQRYASALQIAEDVERHLVNKPVKARGEVRTYLAGKFVRRYRLGLLAAAIVAGLAVSSTVLWRQAVGQRSQAVTAQHQAEQARQQAEQARQQAERAQQQAESVSDFLEELFKSADPDVSGGKPATVRAALDWGREQLAGRLSDEPEVRAKLLGILGTVHAKLGLYGEARELREEALRTRLAADPSDRTELASDLNNLGETLFNLGKPAAAENHLRRALAMWRRLRDAPNTELVLRNLVSALMQQGRYEEALRHHRQILELQRGLYDAGDPRVASSFYILGALYRQRGEPRAAEPFLRQALLIYTRNFGLHHTNVANVQNSLGRALHAQGHHPEARELLEAALETRLQLLGEDHEKVANSRKNLASLLLEMGETHAAGKLLEPALDTLRRTLPPGDWKIADAESVWGSYLVVLGRYAQAEIYLLASYESLRGVRGESDSVTRAALRRVVALYEVWGRADEAARYRAASESWSRP